MITSGWSKEGISSDVSHIIIFHRDAQKELEKVNDLATEAFNLAQDNEARVEATKLKLVAVLMTKVLNPI